MKDCNHFHKRQRMSNLSGAALLELSLAIPVMLVLTFGMFELSNILQHDQMANAVSREMANSGFRDCAFATDPNACLGDLLSEYNSSVDDLLPGAQVTVSIYRYVPGAAAIASPPVAVPLQPIDQTSEINASAYQVSESVGNQAFADADPGIGIDIGIGVGVGEGVSALSNSAPLENDYADFDRYIASDFDSHAGGGLNIGVGAGSGGLQGGSEQTAELEFETGLGGQKGGSGGSGSTPKALLAAKVSIGASGNSSQYSPGDLTTFQQSASALSPEVPVICVAEVWYPNNTVSSTLLNLWNDSSRYVVSIF